MPSQHSQVTGGNNESCKVRCMLVYYPYRDMAESNPFYFDPFLDSDRDEDSDVFRRNHQTPHSTDGLFSVYWQGRLVPESKMNELKVLFDGLITARVLREAGISPHWKDRVKGFIFFDSKFTFISNNKLRIAVESGLETWINSRGIYEKTITDPRESKLGVLFKG